MFVFGVFFLVFEVVTAASRRHPAVHYGHKDYTAHYTGSESTPLVMSIPHGGNMASDSLRIRHRGCWNSTTEECTYRHNCKGIGTRERSRCYVSTVSDVYTVNMGVMIRDFLGEMTGVYPHLIVNRLQRSWMDPDDDIDKGTFGEREAIQAYTEYHHFIEQAISRVNGTALLVNLVGHFTSEDLVELGYLISSRDLKSGDYSAADTSIASIFNNSPNVSSISDLVSGPFSLGTLLQGYNYNTVPSEENPFPPYYRYHHASYTTEYYNSDKVAAIELNIPHSLRDKVAGELFSKDLAESMVQYFQAHFPYCVEACTISSSGLILKPPIIIELAFCVLVAIKMLC